MLRNSLRQIQALFSVLFVMGCLCLSQAQSIHSAPYTIYGYPPVPQGSHVQDVVGATNVSPAYNFDSSVTSLEEGAYRLGVNTDAHLIDPDTGLQAVGLGSHVIKLWFDATDPVQGSFPNVTNTVTYPGVTNWGTVTNLKQLAASPPFAEMFSNTNFNTYILEAFEFDSDCHDVWRAPTTKWTTTAKNCVYNEFFNLTQYLLTTYSGTGKTFVLQNWESDNALNAGTFSPVPAIGETCTTPTEPNYPADFCTSIANMTEWLNIRWQAVNDARNPALTTYNNVTVAAAAEVKFVDNYETTGLPTFMDLILPNLHMDLYSCSCYYTDSNAANLSGVPAGSPPRPQNLYNEIQEIVAKIKQPQTGDSGTPLYQNAANSMYVGEFSSLESNYYTNDNWGAAYADPLTGQSMPTDQQARVVLGQEVQGGLAANLKWMMFWNLYSNSPTSYSSPPYNSISSYWLVRPPCTSLYASQEWCTDSSHAGQTSKPEYWNYLANVMTQPRTSYKNTYEAENSYTGISGPATSGHTLTEVDLADANASGNYATYLEYAAIGSTLHYSMFVPSAGSQNVNIRYKNGTTHGQFQVYLNGSSSPLPGGPFETYGTSGGYATLSIGNVNLLAGDNTFALTVSGKNSAASAYNLVIDNLQIGNPVP